MKERPVLTVVIGYIIGILWGLYFEFSIVPCYFLMTTFIFILKLFSRKTSRKIQRKHKFKLLSIKRYSRYLKILINQKAIIIIIIFSIISNTVLIIQNKKHYNKFKDNEEIQFTGIIIGEKIEKQYYNTYKVKVINSKHFNLYIQVNKKEKDYEYGDMIKIKGTYLTPSKQRNYGGYDDFIKLKTLKIVGRVKVKKIELTGKRKINIISQNANYLKKRIEKNLNDNFNNENAAILKGLIIGDKEEISQQTREELQTLNISHILAISGMHINYIIIFLKKIFEKNLGKRRSKIIIILFLIFYNFITGFSPSILRATIMGIIIQGENIVYRKSDYWNSISLSLLVTLIYNPYLILDMGLQLSYLATIGIVLFKPSISQILGDRFKTIKEIISVTLSAQIIILPITIYYFNILGIYFLITNLLVSFLIGPIIILGFLSVVIPSIICPITSFFLKFIFLICEFSKFPLSKIYISTPKKSIIIIYFILIFICKKLYILNKLNKPNPTQKRVKNLIQLLKYKIKIEGKDKNNNKKKAIIITVSSIIVISLTAVFKSNLSLKIHFVDVGQGDCTLIRTPNNKTILIDGGGSTTEEFDVGKSILLPYLLDRGYTIIDYIIISHFDQDHVRTDY